MTYNFNSAISSTWQQFVTLLLAQVSKKDSLRDIELSFKVNCKPNFHFGIKKVKRSTLADALNQHDYRVSQLTFILNHWQ
jgi:hypothetical protein